MPDYIRFDREAARAAIRQRHQPPPDDTLAEFSEGLADNAKARDNTENRANARDDASMSGCFSRFSGFSRGSGLDGDSAIRPIATPPPSPRDMICPRCRTFSIMRLAQGLECSRCALVVLPMNEMI
jgi:hypothetical protein